MKCIAAAMMVMAGCGFAQVQWGGGDQPPFQIGMGFGRTGGANGQEILAQANIKKFVGLYGYLGRSNFNGYQTQGVTANFSDLTAGFGIVSRVVGFRRFGFGIYSQAAYDVSHIIASYSDGMGGTIQSREIDKDPIVGLGLDAEYRIPHSDAVLLVRPGRNFGSSIAANTAGGFSFNAAVVVGVKDIAKGWKAVQKYFP